MTSLNSKLQLALLNRKKGRNLLEKGFTLVELMIVIVIVGILSSVALPSFLNQRGKATATEATQKISVILKDAAAELGEGLTPTEIVANAQASVTNTASNEESFVYSIVAGTDVNNEPGSICVLATGKDAAPTVKDKFVAGGYAFSARKPNVRSNLLTTTPLADAAACTTLATPADFGTT